MSMRSQDVRGGIERFRTLRDTAFRDPASYFHRYASLSDQAAHQRAHAIWTEINEVRLEILPTRRQRSHLGAGTMVA
jgi:type I pantothenate kinase